MSDTEYVMHTVFELVGDFTDRDFYWDDGDLPLNIRKEDLPEFAAELSFLLGVEMPEEEIRRCISVDDLWRLVLKLCPESVGPDDYEDDLWLASGQLPLPFKSEEVEDATDSACGI